MTTQPQALYREPVQLNAQLHRHKRLRPFDDISVLASTHAVFLNTVEFAKSALAFPVIFVAADKDRPQVAPMALLGLVPNDNLFVEGNRWDASYMPALFRRMPYLTAPLPGTDQIGVYIDAQWPALSDTEGEPLFTAEGEQSPILLQAIEFLKAFDAETKRTAEVCARIDALGLFIDMTADVNLPNGETLSIDGFKIVDENKFADLPDAVVLELYRNGTLGLIQSHLLSLNHMSSLIDRHVRRISNAD